MQIGMPIRLRAIMVVLLATLVPFSLVGCSCTSGGGAGTDGVGEDGQGVVPATDLWLMPGHDAGWTFQTAVKLSPPLTQAWTSKLGAGYADSVIVGDGTLYALVGEHVAESATLFAVDTATRKIRWRRKLPVGEMYTSLTDKYVLFSVDRFNEATNKSRSTLSALAKKDGKDAWTYSVNGSIRNLLVNNTIAYIQVDAESESFLAGIDIATGKEQWRARIDANDRLVAVAGDVLYSMASTAENDSTTITAQSLGKDGGKPQRQLWSKKAPGAGLLACDGRVAVAAMVSLEGAGEKTDVFAYEPQSGKLLWKADIPLPAWQLAIGSERVVVGGIAANGGSLIHAFDERTGKKAWAYAGPAKLPVFEMIVAPNVVYGLAGTEEEFNHFNGVLLAVDVKTGKEVWKKKLGTLVSHMAPAEGALYVTDSPDAKAAAQEPGGSVRVLSFR